MNFKVPALDPGLRLLSRLSLLTLFIAVVVILSISIGQGDRSELERAIKAQTNNLIGQQHGL